MSVELFRKALERQGHTVYVFCPKYSKDRFDEADTIIRFNSTPGIWYEGYRDTFPWTPKNIRYIKSLDLDVVHIHTYAQIGILGVRISKEENIPLINTYHTDVVNYSTIYKRLPFGATLALIIGKMTVRNSVSYREIFQVFKPDEKQNIRWNQKVVKDIVKISNNICDLVIVPSEKIKNMIISYGTTAPIEIMPTGLDPDDVSKTKLIPQKLADKIKGANPILLGVGRLGAEKNFQLIIDALPHLIEKYPKIKLVLVGGGPYHEELKTLAHTNNVSDHVIFSGWLDRSYILNVYHHADIFVFPSTTDTQGLVVNEAYSAKLPTVFCDEQISSLLQDNKTGLLSKNEARDFADNILYLIDHPQKAKSFGQAGFELSKELNINKQAKKLVTMYQEVTTKKGQKAWKKF